MASSNSRASPMKLPQLKEKVFEAWEFLSGYRGCVVLPENFKPEVRREFGDLRRKDTWIRALARYEALNAFHDCLDAYHLVLHALNFTSDRWDYDYRHLIFDEFLMIPGALDLIKLGFEQLLSVSFTDQDREEAHGFFELVAEQQGRVGLPVEFAGRLPTAHAA
jgi:hypothetical protein